MDEVTINTINWASPEYTHKERSNDWFWLLGLVTIIACGLALWQHNNMFAVFIFISGCCIVMFNIKHPQNLNYIIETKGLTMGKDFHSWKSLKSFNIKNNDTDAYAKLLVETSKYFLPIYTIFLPKEMEKEVKEELLKVLPKSEINESGSMVFMEKLGF